jgi:GrpB-like predicted nucleotidyltransferase (UPF0157 family)
MAKNNAPVMRLIGGVRLQDTDWDLASYRQLFDKFNAIASPGVVTRLVRYYGVVGGRTLIRFFGVEVDSIESIPEGFVAMELDEEMMTVYRPAPGKPSVVWQKNLVWNWLDRSVPSAPVGDFSVLIPDNWGFPTQGRPVTFALSANSYFKKDSPADDDVRLTDYDTDWPDMYEMMAALVRNSTNPEIVRRIEHFGSTAIPGMPAKPVIDMLLGIPSFTAARQALIPVFNQQAIEYWMQDQDMCFIVRREFLGARTHHLHAAPTGTPYWERLAFRDYLRTHPKDAQLYAALKKDLAARYSTDREEYTIAKGQFINEITAKALKNNP